MCGAPRVAAAAVDRRPRSSGIRSFCGPVQSHGGKKEFLDRIPIDVYLERERLGWLNYEASRSCANALCGYNEDAVRVTEYGFVACLSSFVLHYLLSLSLVERCAAFDTLSIYSDFQFFDTMHP